MKMSSGKIFTLLESLRIHQWVKNILVFVPALMAHNLLDGSVFVKACCAFLSFSFCASAVYQLNDIVDLEADRQHPRKRSRPLASGRLSLQTAYVLIPVLLLLPFVFIGYLPDNFYLGLAFYFFLTTFYTFFAKKIIVLDIILLAALYTIRIIAGGLACGVDVSNWLLVFSMFIFFSLACVKRYSELLLKKDSSNSKLPGRGYLPSDSEQMAQFGITSGYISVLVLGLYINSPEVKNFYTQVELLWLISALLLYWISRIWVLARRNLLHDDPIVFAIKDRVSYLIAALTLLILVLAS